MPIMQSHAHIQGETVDQEMDRMRFIVPKRIAVRYAQHFKLPRLDLYRYDMTSSITKAKVCTAEFKIRWAYMRARLSDDELFSLFKDSGFSPRDHEVTGIAFVRAVLQRYKDAKVFSGFYQYVFLYAFALFTYCLRVRSSCLPA